MKNYFIVTLDKKKNCIYKSVEICFSQIYDRWPDGKFENYLGWNGYTCRS